MGTGATPTVNVSGSSAAVSWAASTVSAGVNATSYTVAYYAAATGGTAEGTQTCNSTSCTFTNVASGDHYWGVTPVYRNWVGTEGTRTKATVSTTAPLAISSASGNNGNTKVTFSGSGGAVGATVTVTVCSNATCSETVTSVTATVTAGGTWTTADTGNSLSASVNYYARANQTTPSATSAIVGPFQAKNGSYNF
jgi:hypothetical protein